jgi:hypothetical protein
MLIPTNGTFFAVNGVNLPLWGETLAFTCMVWVTSRPPRGTGAIRWPAFRFGEFAES